MYNILVVFLVEITNIALLDSYGNQAKSEKILVISLDLSWVLGNFRLTATFFLFFTFECNQG